MKPIKGVYWECPICNKKWFTEQLAKRCIWKHSLPQYCSSRLIIKKGKHILSTPALVLVSDPHE